jgi:hypothetical protein
MRNFNRKKVKSIMTILYVPLVIAFFIINPIESTSTFFSIICALLFPMALFFGLLPLLVIFGIFAEIVKLLIKVLTTFWGWLHK